MVHLVGWVDGPASTNGTVPKINFSCARTSNAPDSTWTGRIIVPQYSANGIWKVGMLRLQYNSIASIQYGPTDPILARGYFEVN